LDHGNSGVVRRDVVFRAVGPAHGRDDCLHLRSRAQCHGRPSSPIRKEGRVMTWTILEFLFVPGVAALVIVGIHAYLGLHVVERGVIFVDLALAQIASLGAAVAVLIPAFRADPHGAGVYWMSLAFTFIGATVFSVIKGQK